MAGVACKRPQATYVDLQNTFQQGWAFVQHSTKGPGEDFWPVENYLREDFLLSLFLGVEENFPNRTIMLLPVKYTGIVIPDPNLTAQVNWITLCMITRHLVAALRVHVRFFSRDHVQLLTDCKADIRCHKGQEVEESPSAMAGGLSPTEI